MSKVILNTDMTDEMAEIIAEKCRCCGGIALDIYEAVLDQARKEMATLPLTIVVAGKTGSGKSLATMQILKAVKGAHVAVGEETERYAEIIEIVSIK